ncbi:hypothetical protein STANM309S_02184 [Streptomyces tanashiensis]
METQPSSATRARSPSVKPTTSGMCAYTLLATTRSAGPCSARTAAPVSGDRNSVSVGTPASRAAAPTFTDGSTPRQRIPRSTTCRSRYPSLLATSTTKASEPSPTRSTAPATNVRACSTQEVEYEEKYAYSWKVSSGVISGGICASQQSVQTRRCSGYAGSGRSSRSAARKLSHGGVAPRSTTLASAAEPQSRHRVI